jgi:ribosome maturation factor RimP
METGQDLEQIIDPLLESMGLNLVEMSIGRHRGDVTVNLVLYKKGGIGLDDLTRAQKLLRPRLELEFDRSGLSVEISSPGTSRVIKSPGEYRIFTGRKLRVLVGDDWVEGLLTASDGLTVSLDVDGTVMDIPLDQIRKARLE